LSGGTSNETSDLTSEANNLESSMQDDLDTTSTKENKENDGVDNAIMAPFGWLNFD